MLDPGATKRLPASMAERIWSRSISSEEMSISSSSRPRPEVSMRLMPVSVPDAEMSDTPESTFRLDRLTMLLVNLPRMSENLFSSG